MFGGPGLSGLLAAMMGIQPMFGLTAFVCLAIGEGIVAFPVKFRRIPPILIQQRSKVLRR